MDKNVAHKELLGNPIVFTLTVVVISLLFSFVMTFIYSYLFPQIFMEMPHPGHGLSMQQTYLYVRVFIDTFNIALLTALFVIYVKAYSKIKANFTLGLSIFILVMLIQEIVSYPLVHISFGYSGIALGPFYIIPKILESFAIIIFFYLSIE